MPETSPANGGTGRRPHFGWRKRGQLAAATAVATAAVALAGTSFAAAPVLPVAPASSGVSVLAAFAGSGGTARAYGAWQGTAWN
jgi:hypothetical protein